MPRHDPQRSTQTMFELGQSDYLFGYAGSDASEDFVANNYLCGFDFERSELLALKHEIHLSNIRDMNRRFRH